MKNLIMLPVKLDLQSKVMDSTTLKRHHVPEIKLEKLKMFDEETERVEVEK